jgi:hypothetical protein
MTNTFKRLISGTRTLESRLTKAFEQAAETVSGVNASRPPLEIVDMAVDAIAAHVQPAGRGRYTFPFNSVTVTFVAATPEDQVRFEAICAGPPSIEDRVQRRLASAGCDDSEGQVFVEFTAEPGPAWNRQEFDLALARVTIEPRVVEKPVTRVDLAVTNGTAASAAYSFTDFPIAIGRGADVRDNRNQLLRINHVAFVGGHDTDAEINGTVSRRHARIELDEATGRPRLIDDNSAQGSSVIRGSRGIAVPRGSRGLGLQSGDEIVLGQARMKVTIELPAPATASTPRRPQR